MYSGLRTWACARLCPAGLTALLLAALIVPARAERPATGAASTPAASSSRPVTARAELEITPQAVQEAAARLEQSAAEPAVKAKAAELHHQAGEQVQAAVDALARAAQLRQEWQDAPAQLAAARALLATPATAPAIDVKSDTPLAQVEQLAAQAQLESSAARRELTEAENQPKQRAERRTEMPRLLAANRAQVEELDRQSALPPPAQEAAEISAARKLLLQAQRQALLAQAQALRMEQRVADATGELLTARRDLAARRAALAQRRARTLAALVAQQRAQEAQQAVNEARAAVERVAAVHPLLERLAQENEALAARRAGPDGLAARMEELDRLYQARIRQLVALRGDFRSIQERVNALGGSAVEIGQLLRRERASIPAPAGLWAELEPLTAQGPQIQLRWLEARDERNRLDDIDARAEALVAAARPPVPENLRDEVLADARTLLETRRGYLDALIADYTAYSNRLVDLGIVTTRLADEAVKDRAYIDERVLWIPSGPPLWRLDRPALAEAAVWLVTPENWWTTLRLAGNFLAQRPGLLGGALVLLAALLLVRWRLHVRLVALEPQEQAPHELGPTMQAVTLTVVRAVLGFLIIWLAAAVLAQTAGAEEFPAAVAAGLRALAVGYVTLELLVRIFHPRGLAHLHFAWAPGGVTSMRRRLTALAAAGLPLLVIVAMLQQQPVEARRQGLGLVVFLAGMAALAGFAWLTLRPWRPPMSQALQRLASGWLARSRHVWFAVALLLPIGLGAAAALGYGYTTVELSWRALLSLWLGLGLLILSALGRRWSGAARRAAVLPQVLGRLALRRRHGSAGSAGSVAQTAAEAAERPAVGLADMRRQSRRLSHVVLAVLLVGGLWLIWADMVPALGALKRVPLWTTAQSVAGEGGAHVERVVPVTLADVLWAGLTLALVLTATRNLPGLMQILLANRLGLTSGGLYALTTLLRYGIIVAGVITACGLVGLSWSSIQWLVAAVTVGLGFGLQEIFANFVSGLILLFERPIRVGDIITVNGVSGTVTRIRTRATTVLDFDHKELIVPNKSFITGQVVNWTLSDTMLRLVVPVNVAFGADVGRAMALILQAAQDNGRVLREPPATVLLIGFGPNAVKMELRAYVGDLDSYRQVRHDLHEAVAKALGAANIPLAAT